MMLADQRIIQLYVVTPFFSLQEEKRISWSVKRVKVMIYIYIYIYIEGSYIILLGFGAQVCLKINFTVKAAFEIFYILLQIFLG